MITDPTPKRVLRVLIDDTREFPATMALGAAWVVVFVMMVASRLATSPLPSLQDVLVGNIGGAHAYGDMTLREVFRGEVWRVVTCTFVHYNVLHIGMNLYGLYQLGALVESWYGSGQFLAVYLVIGGGGNLLSALVRHAQGMEPRMHSGGGSTVVLGLVGLCAVVGWRARSRIGDYLRGQMVGILLFTAFLGMMLPIIDNWGHAGGALVGAIVGFAHRILIRTAARPLARWAGTLATLVMLLCGAAQWRDNQVEGAYRPRLAAEEERMRSTLQLRLNLAQLGIFYQNAAQRSAFEHAGRVARTDLLASRPPARSPREVAFRLLFAPLASLQADQALYCKTLDEARETLGTRPTGDAFHRVRRLLVGVFEKPPTPRIKNGFHYDLGLLIRRTEQDLRAARARWAKAARAAGIE